MQERPIAAENAPNMADPEIKLPDENGRFGPYGGQYVPETLMAALADL